MAIVVQATYENGVLKPERLLPLVENERVQVIIEPEVDWVERTYGLLRWTGDPETLRRIAEEPESAMLESP